MSPVDYANTAHARENRERKATALAAAARQLSVTSNGIAIGGGRRRVVWKAAGLDRSPSEDTWAATAALLGEPEPRTPRGPQRRLCRYRDGRQAGLYLGGWLCDEHAPWAHGSGRPPTPPPGSTAEDLRARRLELLAAEEAARTAVPMTRRG